MTISATAGTPEAISFGGEANPYALYARLRRQAPVSHMSLPDGGEFWLVTRYEDAKNALADPRLSKDPNRVGERWRATVAQPTDGEDASLVRHLLNVDPPDHTRLRRLVHKGFTPRRIEALRGRIQTRSPTVSWLGGRVLDLGHGLRSVFLAAAVLTLAGCSIAWCEWRVDRRASRTPESTPLTGAATAPAAPHLRTAPGGVRRRPPENVRTQK
ncbi:hypothetical protein SXANM310S_02190 [Streptomyces xanthochromogenes]